MHNESELALYLIPFRPFSILIQEKDQKYSLRTDEMRVKDVEVGRFSIGKKFAFALFYNSGK